jgi:hypothetical protein
MHVMTCGMNRSMPRLMCDHTPAFDVCCEFSGVHTRGEAPRLWAEVGGAQAVEGVVLVNLRIMGVCVCMRVYASMYVSCV